MPGYLIALGSNIRHVRHGSPHQVIEAALAALQEQGVEVQHRSRVIASLPLGPSLRRYANAAVVVTTALDPPELLARLKAMETAFGKRRGGRPWRARVLDLDIVLWSSGIWVSPRLAIPHPAFRERAFVLRPAMDVAPDWRDPVTGLKVRHLFARLTRSSAAPR
jgi:2-amino-4-hydroxy-6-hydroxymethyldihydropteridine diphosphokinase